MRKQQLLTLFILTCPAGFFLYFYLTGAVPVLFGIFPAGLAVSTVLYRRTGNRYWLATAVYSLVLTFYYPAAGFLLPAGLYRGVAFFLLLAVASFCLYLFVFREKGRIFWYFSLFTGGLGLFGLIFLDGEYTKIFPVYLITIGFWLVIKGLVLFFGAKKTKEHEGIPSN